MVNETIQEISREMFGESIRDGEAYWKIIRNTMTNDEVPEDKAIVKNSAGKAYSFKKSISKPRDLSADDERKAAEKTEHEPR